MAAKTVAFRINPKNREDQEIMDWLDEVVIQQQIYESYTEALKWAVLSFLRGEAKSREQLDMLETRTASLIHNPTDGRFGSALPSDSLLLSVSPSS